MFFSGYGSARLKACPITTISGIGLDRYALSSPSQYVCTSALGGIRSIGEINCSLDIKEKSFAQCFAESDNVASSPEFTREMMWGATKVKKLGQCAR